MRPMTGGRASGRANGRASDRARRAGARPDPAPSRLAYRLHRMRMSRLFRFGLRVGLPMAAAFLATWWYLADDARRTALLERGRALWNALENRPEFEIRLVAIEGASPALARRIRETVGLDLPVSSFDVDLEAIHDRLIGLLPVRSASVRVRPGGVLEIAVSERLPVLVWRRQDGRHVLLDEEGVAIGVLPTRVARPDLPLVTGSGAHRAVTEALALLAAAEPVAPMVQGLERIGERRWDLVLEGGLRVMLPAEDPVTALERTLALHETQDLLSRDLVAVDLRLPGRTTVRLGQWALTELDRIRKFSAETDMADR